MKSAQQIQSEIESYFDWSNANTAYYFQQDIRKYFFTLYDLRDWTNVAKALRQMFNDHNRTHCIKKHQIAWKLPLFKGKPIKLKFGAIIIDVPQIRNMSGFRYNKWKSICH